MGTGGNQVPILTENIPSEAYTIPHDERSMCCQPGMSDTLTHYVHYVAYSMGHDERSSQFEKNKTDPLTASDYKQPPVVAQMSTTGGAERLCNRGWSNESDNDDAKDRGVELYAQWRSKSNAETCNGKQTVGSLCAHDGRGFNGQDVANDKLIVEHYETDNNS